MIFNVTTTDWVALAQAIKSVNSITKRVIRQEIELMLLKTDGKEQKFWRSLYECY